MLGDPHFELVKGGNNACSNQQERFWAEWDDNGPNCVNEVLFVYAETTRYKLEVYHTNRLVAIPETSPQEFGSVIENIRVIFAEEGLSPVTVQYSYANVPAPRTDWYGELSLQITPVSDQGENYLQLQFGWAQINDLEFLGGGVGVVLKKVISSGGYWSSPTGSNVDGFSLAGSSLNISRDDLEMAAQSGPNTANWNKVIFPGDDFTPLTENATFNICRERRIFAWDPFLILPFLPPPTPTPSADCNSALFISVDRGGETGGTCLYATALGAEVGSYFSCFCSLPTTAWLGINAGGAGYEQGDGQTIRFLAGDRHCVGGVLYPMTVAFTVQWTNVADHGKPLTVTASWADSTQSIVLSPGANINCPYNASMLYAQIFENGSLVFGTNP